VADVCGTSSVTADHVNGVGPAECGCRAAVVVKFDWYTGHRERRAVAGDAHGVQNILGSTSTIREGLGPSAVAAQAFRFHRHGLEDSRIIHPAHKDPHNLAPTSPAPVRRSGLAVVLGVGIVRYKFVSGRARIIRLVWHGDIRYSGDSIAYGYDGNGGRGYEHPWCAGCDSTTKVGHRHYYYDGLGRTAGTYEKVGFDTWVSSSCNYDPVGRLFGPCGNFGLYLGYDGDNVVRTQRDSATSQVWTFIHGPGVDDPLMGRYATPDKYVYFLTDGQGRQYAVADSSGSDVTGELYYVDHGGRFAGGTENARTFAAARYPNANMPQLSFFRNRFYDQQTGRWTQEDPIGVAGGINLYSYVGNNPVGFTDPFGLCKKDGRGDEPPKTFVSPMPVRCPGGREGIQQVRSHLVEDPTQLKRFRAFVKTLQGGSSDFTLADVRAQYNDVINRGAVYTFSPVTADGGEVQYGGGASEGGPLFGGSLVTFPTNVWGRIQGPRPDATTCEYAGHEGVHLVQYSRGRVARDPRNDLEATLVNWRCRR
jgi:RHS repeat-associated protein